MHKYLVLFSAILLAVAVSAPARAADDGFCAMVPSEMLAALDGTWQLRQGAGTALAAGMAIPLPAHPAQRLKLAYDPHSGTAALTGAAPGETIAMFPIISPEAAATAIGDIGETVWNKYEDIGAGCDWYSIPLVIGTNIYSLTGTAQESASGQGQNNGVQGVLGGQMFLYCFYGYSDYFHPSDGKESHFYWGPFMEDAYSPDELVGDPNVPFAIGGPENNLNCIPPPDVPVVSAGQMTMSLAIKFQSPSSGTGVLVFKGKHDGYDFAAVAPVAFSR